jgi:LysM repeat protein
MRRRSPKLHIDLARLLRLERRRNTVAGLYADPPQAPFTPMLLALPPLTVAPRFAISWAAPRHRHTPGAPHRLRPLLVLFAALVLAAAAARAGGAPPGPLEEPAPGWHIVRPGETLESIAQTFLGSARLWPRLARLNPEVADPNRIEPGQRIQILVARRGVDPVAQFDRLSHQVEEKPSPIAWKEAQVGDLLRELDGVRTFRRSSADMRFTDGTRLVVTEDSLVFLRRAGGGLRPEQKAVEIVEGQADVEARPAVASAPRAASPQIEIVLGGARATSRPGSAGAAQARARRVAQGGSKVMVYGGEGAVEAGGARVELPPGTGSSVAPQGAPSPAEKLLPAPRLLEPPPDAEVRAANPLFTWEAVDGAASYVVEVCADPGCGQLIERAVDVAATEWRPQALPAGVVHWRVTARSRSGLDGYPSTAAGAAILSAEASREGPAVALQVTGPQVPVGSRLFVAPGARLTATFADRGCGLARWVPVADGKEVSAAAWSGAWAPGEHVTTVRAVDRCGNSSTSEPLAFVVDAEPPAIRWQAGEAASFDSRGLVYRAPTTAGDLIPGGRPGPLDWSPGRGWEPLPLSDAAAAFPVRLESDRPQLFLRSSGAALLADGAEVRLGRRQVLWIAAEDAGAGVEHLAIRTKTGAAGLVLEIEAVDVVGNVRRLEWPLANAGKR